MARREYYLVDPADIHYRYSGKKKEASTLILRQQEHRHLSRVLRHRPGDEVQVTDGKGCMYTCVIEDIRRDESMLRITSVVLEAGEPRFLELTLAQAIPRENRFDWVLEKGTEIGLRAFIPMLCARGDVTPREQKQKRWHRVLTSAVKQCGRSRVPQVYAPASFEQVIAESTAFDLLWIAHLPLPEKAETAARRQPSFPAVDDVRSGLLLVGPESGFTEQEVSMAQQAGFTFLDLGPRRLRSETAGIIAAAVLLEQFGELAGTPQSG